MTALPPLTLLNRAAPDVVEVSTDDDVRAVRSALRSHGVDAEVADVDVGPQAVRLRLTLAPGTVPSKVERLVDALTLALGRPVRYGGIVGTTVAVELARAHRGTVALRDLIETGDALTGLGLVVGADIGGNPVSAALSKLPHLLVAGATGQGKSVFINAVLISLLMRCSPDDLTLTMVDPKRVELAAYAALPHLSRPIVTDTSEAIDAIKAAEALMDERYARMEHAGVKDLAAWNDRDVATRWPRHVVVIDELADLMMTARKSVEAPIVRIAQLGRAAGVHLILATQYPKADVITPLIKQNVPSRIAFTTADHVASNLIIGTSGAERLSGAGDALWAPVGAITPTRVQAAWVSPEEVATVVSWWVKADEARRAEEDQRLAEERDRAGLDEVTPPPVAADVLPVGDQLKVEMIREARREADRVHERLAVLERKVREIEDVLGRIADVGVAMIERSGT